MELHSGAELAREVKATRPARLRPQAVFAASDVIAAGFVLEAARIGLRIPSDVAIAGFDNTALGQALTPALTSVHVPQREIGLASARLLLKKLRGEGIGSGVVDVGFSIVVRSSA
jgi:LacI family gluconate utilization system Gnt-I transcriptional repressor